MDSTTAFVKRFFWPFILALGSSFAAQSVQAQDFYGNEWINYSQTYYKIKVINNGVHRLSYGYLDSLGIASADPRHFQLFRRGKEVPVYVVGEEDGRLDPQDYIEFYGERNDGALDSELYKDPRHQIHQLRSMYTDTAAYFLTVSAAGGKRVRNVNPEVTGRTPESYHLQKSVVVFSDVYYRGRQYEGSFFLPWMDQGEGYVASTTRFGKNHTLGNITHIETAGPKPVLNYSVYARNNIEHHASVNIVSPTGTRELSRALINGYGTIYQTNVIEFSDITAGGQVIIQTLPDEYPTTENQMSIPHIILTYPQKGIMAGNSMYFYTDSTRTGSPYFEFSNTLPGTIVYDVTDAYNPVRIAGRAVAGAKGFVVTAEDGRTHKLLLSNADKPFRPQPAHKKNFRRVDPDAYDYIVLTGKQLMAKAEGSALTAPEEYIAYRASDAGGKYKPLLALAEEIIDEFHYGDVSANAIRRFVRYMAASSVPKQLLILGKGIELDRINYRNATARRADIVPAGGVPGSDVFFSADFRNNSYIPALPTGRLSVSTAQGILDYLNKVKEYESQPDGQKWQKNILQLGGGSNIDQINRLSSYLKSYKNIAEGPLLGARVIEKYRQNVSEYIDVINVSGEINAGVSLLTFFGHTATTTQDLDIGYASSPVNGYNNKGKYPFILMNGCGSGNIFLPDNITFGEDWVNTPHKGAIGFIAHVDAGEEFQLNLYSRNFYQTAFQNPSFYGKPIGVIQQEVIRNVTAISASVRTVSLVTQMLLQGDPAIKLYSPEKPDYYLKPNSAEILSDDGRTVTASSPDFILKVGVGNLGKAITDSVGVLIKRTLADNTVLAVAYKVKPILRDDTLHLRLNNTGISALGINTFEVELDPEQKLQELNEENNKMRFQHFFSSSGLAALSPNEYGIISSDNVKLLVQATELQADRQGVYFEIDTTQAFNSTVKKTHTAEQALLSAWDVTLPLAGTDSIVYYWRARFQNYEAGEDTVWAASSFRYIKNSTNGWSQSHYGQFDQATVENLIKGSKEQPDWQFATIRSEIEIRVIGGDSRFALPNYGLVVDGRPMLGPWCGNPAGSAVARMYVYVANPNDLKPAEGLVPEYACSEMPGLYEFGDLGSAANRAKIESLLKAVPEGYYVAAMTVNKVPFKSFTPAIRTAFNSIGSKLIDELDNSHPFAIVGRKGAAPGTVAEATAVADEVTPPTSQSVVLQETLWSKRPSGTLISSVIGPAMSWGSLHYNIERNGGGKDEYKLSLIGIDQAGQQQVIEEDIRSKHFDLSTVDAAQFPSLQLTAVLSDSVERTAPQLKQWLVYYEAAPEGVIRPDLVNVSEQPLSAQAEKGSITVPMVFENITPYAFRDSLVVEVTVTGDGIQPNVSRFKIAALDGYQKAQFNFSMPTVALSGSYKVSMFVNPRLHPEQHYFNNVFEVPFKVRERLHPILDVAFDGVHILDGELVSPSPLISVLVKDENKHRFLQDPTGMSIIMISPAGQEQEVNLMNNPQEVRFFPADEKNDFRLEYKPAKLENGSYIMEVRARDVEGKASGLAPYRISFEVENQSSITNFYPFPNPFSSKTNFIFTLTGSTVPEHLKIQILTVTGKVVREITKEELGPIRIGNNKSEYAWDGTDMYGDKLANGVYLYRVVISQGDEGMRHRNTFGQKAFHNGYGKIYILR